MSSDSRESRSRQWHHLVVVALVVVTLALAAGIFNWNFDQEMAAGNLPGESRYYEGSVKGGELWYRVRRFSGNPLSPIVTTRLKRLNLETGEDRDTELAFDEDYVLPIWIGDALYVYTYTGIYLVDGTTSVKLDPSPFAWCLSLPFLYEGHLTVVFDENKFNNGDRENVRLAHWIDGKWNVGRRILLPGSGQFWIDDAERGRKVLLPRMSQFTRVKTSACTSYFFPYNLITARQDEKWHLFMTAMSCMHAEYRNGFEFADELSECPSAMAPENAPFEVSGWEPILANRADDDWIQMSCDRDGLLFASSNRPRRLVRQQSNGQRVELIGDDLNRAAEGAFIWIASEPNSSPSYVILSDQFWGSATIRRIEGNRIHPPHHEVPGYQRAYIARWQVVCLRLLSVWLIPNAVLLVWANWISCRRQDVDLESLIPLPQLATVLRRCVAFVIDVALFVAASWLTWRMLLWIFRLTWIPGSRQTLANTLVDLEWDIRSLKWRAIMTTLSHSPLNWLVLPFDFRNDFFGLLVASTGPFLIAKVFAEGRFGLSPGKWLVGIRVLRTSFRPCGFARSLLRNVFFCVDFPSFLTPLPAVISILYSDRRQRLGDRLADSIVVCAQSTLPRKT